MALQVLHNIAQPFAHDYLYVISNVKEKIRKMYIEKKF